MQEINIKAIMSLFCQGLSLIERADHRHMYNYIQLLTMTLTVIILVYAFYFL